MGAIMLSYGVITALLARERYGVGQEVNASHLGSMIALQGLNVSLRNIMGKEFRRNTRDERFQSAVESLPMRRRQMVHARDAAAGSLLEGPLQHARHARADRGSALQRTSACAARTASALVAIFDKVFITKPRDEWMKHSQGAAATLSTPSSTGHRPARRSAGAGQRLRRRLRASGTGHYEARRHAGQAQRDARAIRAATRRSSANIPR